MNQPLTNTEYLLSQDMVILSTSDLKGNIIDYNQAFKEASGYSDSELIGQPHNLIRHPDMPKEAFYDFWHTIQAGYPWLGVMKNKRKNGQYYWVAATASPIKVAGKITGYHSVRYPATDEQKRQASALYEQVKAGKIRFPFHLNTHNNKNAQIVASSDQIIQHLKSLDKLPQLPLALVELQRALNDPKVRHSDLEQIIMKDPMLTLEIVRTSNTPKYNQSNKIESLAEAISRLGMAEVENIGYQVSMSGFQVKSSVVKATPFLENALLSGYIAKQLAQVVDKPINPNLAFMCGIFHDIGVLLMAAYDDAKLMLIRKANTSSMISVIKDERGIYGVLHPALGGTMLREWGLQREVVMGVAGHHTPSKLKGEDGDYAKITFLAELGSRLKGKDYGYFSTLSVDPDQGLATLGYFGLSLADYMALLDQAEETYNGSVA